MIWFVDLTLHPLVPIRRRVVPSSARTVQGMTWNGTMTLSRCIPDSTSSRFWVNATSAREALQIAQELVE